MTKDEALKVALEVLENSKLTHYYCEDIWYTCPKHEEGCANEAEGDECTCGADKANAEIEKALNAIQEALAQQPAKPWVGLTDEAVIEEAKWHLGEMQVENCGADNIQAFVRAIEAAHGITGESK